MGKIFLEENNASSVPIYPVENLGDFLTWEIKHLEAINDLVDCAEDFALLSKEERIHFACKVNPMGKVYLSDLLFKKSNKKEMRKLFKKKEQKKIKEEISKTMDQIKKWFGC